MATVAGEAGRRVHRPDFLSGTPRAGAIDRWIYVFTAVSFVVIALAGFIPDSIEKIAAVEAGARPPFPLVLHMHAVLMGSFLLLLLAQTVLVATGRCDLHRRLGLAAMVIAPALVLVGFILVPTIYHQVWDFAQSAPPEAREALQQRLRILDNIMLLQIRVGLLFPLFLLIGLRARRGDAGLHKRMMILATLAALPAAIDRMHWLPSTMPASPLATDLYTLLCIAPMFFWDVARNRSVHRAWLIWLGISLPFAVAVHGLWDTAGWHGAARGLMGV
jgi:uncharacterized membrane protein YozB (DUF420 family)